MVEKYGQFAARDLPVGVEVRERQRIPRRGVDLCVGDDPAEEVAGFGDGHRIGEGAEVDGRVE